MKFLLGILFIFLARKEGLKGLHMEVLGIFEAGCCIFRLNFPACKSSMQYQLNLLTLNIGIKKEIESFT